MVSEQTREGGGVGGVGGVGWGGVGGGWGSGVRWSFESREAANSILSRDPFSSKPPETQEKRLKERWLERMGNQHLEFRGPVKAWLEKDTKRKAT